MIRLHRCRALRPATRHALPALSPWAPAARAATTLTPAILNHLETMKKRYFAVEDEMTALSEAGDHTKIARLGKEFSDLSKAMELYSTREAAAKSMQELMAMQSESDTLTDGDKEMEEMIALELEEIEQGLAETEEKLMKQLVPRDSADDRGVVLEVRAGTGGDEASLFSGELFKMYEKLCGRQGWRWELLSLSKTDIGGFKEATAVISGELVYKTLKFESGVHRVQRIPVNDTKIQTSAASVVVLPEAEDVDIELRPQDIKVDVMRSQGAGGQNVNKTESAVRMTHLPTGLKVEMQDERSQVQNRAKALKILRSRVYDHERRKREAERSELRTQAQGTGDRSDKIRTYNFPQDRVTDHRVSVSISGVSRVLNGEEALRGIMDELMDAEEKDRIEQFLSGLESSK